MEKKTIGEFISVLRKANGMTQRELGEKLFVSDKTISRWERGECTPELSLIPLIAEIFCITTDELLRGERNNTSGDKAETDGFANRQNAKSDKQIKLMLENKKRKYQNLTLISVGITIFGFIAALIANLGFSKGLLAFCFAAACSVASEICQICFAINARVIIDEDDNRYADRIQETNTRAVKTAVIVTFINLSLIAFCLPLVTLINGANFGIRFDSWVGLGTVFTLTVLPVSYILYAFFVRKALSDKGLLVYNDREVSILHYNNALLKKILIVSICVAFVIGLCIFVWNTLGASTLTKELRFDNCEDFKAFLEKDYERWVKDGYSYIDENGDVIVKVPGIPDNIITAPEDEKTEDYYNKKYEKIYNTNGEIICEYYYNPQLYKSIVFTESAENKMPVTVITKDNYYNSIAIHQGVESLLYALIVLNFAVAAGIYTVKIHKNSNVA